MAKKSIAIIGGGPASLMLACSLDNTKYTISIYEKNSALGRKFLVAGKGGFNLTHSEDDRQFVMRYHPQQFIEPFFSHFSNSDFRAWLKMIGIDTYVGTSKRVFPVKNIKPIQVLKAIEQQLTANHVSIFCEHEWRGWKNHQLLFRVRGQEVHMQADGVVFALGGASWKVTGSDGSWASYFDEKGITVNPFYPSNCAYQLAWDPQFIANYHGHSLKNVAFSCGNLTQKGEAVATTFGIEGSGVYALSKTIRDQLLQQQFAELQIDFKPNVSLEDLTHQLNSRGRLSMKELLKKKVRLSALQIDLIKYHSPKSSYTTTNVLAKLIKSFPVTLTGFAPTDEAISTVGGISLDEITTNLELKKLPYHYCIGEMLDWDAPTGGYLLQACFSMGKYLAHQLNQNDIRP